MDVMGSCFEDPCGVDDSLAPIQVTTASTGQERLVTNTGLTSMRAQSSGLFCSGYDNLVDMMLLDANFSSLAPKFPLKMATVSEGQKVKDLKALVIKSYATIVGTKLRKGLQIWELVIQAFYLIL